MAYLCWVGWLEVYGMIVSVNVGFLCTAVLQFVGVLWMVESRKFIWLFVSHCNVNLSVGCIVLKSVHTFLTTPRTTSHTIPVKHKIIKYFTYVDDILVIYDTNHTKAQNIFILLEICKPDDGHRVGRPSGFINT